LRQVKYKRLPVVGPRPTWVDGDLVDFLTEIPNLFSFRYVPSLKVINGLLSKGRSDAGMSGGAAWKPFSITPDEYTEIVAYLHANPMLRGRPLVFAAVPDHIGIEEWDCWVTSTETGAPFEKLLHLTLEERRLSALHRQLAEVGDNEASSEAHLNWYDAASALHEFVIPYLRPAEDRTDAS
jgi:hypothetical protein